MTELDPHTLPLATAGKALNRVIGTQVDDQGVSSLALFPLKVLAATGGRIVKVSIATTPATPGEEQPATLTVITDDGGSYPVKFTIPPGARGYSITDVECEQENVTPGEASTIKLTFSLDDGSKLSPIEVKLPPGKDSLTITDTSVTQEPIEPGKPSKVTVTVTHSDGSKAVYSYEAPPGAEGYVDSEHFVTRKSGLLNSPTIYFGPDESYTLIPQSDGSLVAYDDKKNVLFSLNNKEGHIGAEKIATTSDVQAEAMRAEAAEAQLLPLTGGKLSSSLTVNGQFAQNGETLSGSLGASVGNGLFYMQAIHPDNSDHMLGRLCIKDLNGSFFRVLEADTQGNLKNLKGKLLATTSDVQVETTRAQNVEASLLSSKPASVSDAKLGNIVWNTDGGLLATQAEGQDQWETYYPTGKSAEALTYSVQDARPKTIRTVKSGWQDEPQLIVENDGFADFNGASVEAVTKVVNAETSRAEAAEATLLPLTGGKLSGVLTVNGQFAQNGETLSERLGTQVDNGQFYMQAIHPDNSDHMLGRLCIKDLNGSFKRVLEADTQGNLKNLNGKLLATTDDVQTIESTLISGTLGMGKTDKAGRGLYTNMQTGRANYSDETGSVKEFLWASEFEAFTNRFQIWTATASYGDWIYFPKPLDNFINDGINCNVLIFMNVISLVNTNDGGNSIYLCNISRDNNKPEIEYNRFRVIVTHYYQAKHDAKGSHSPPTLIQFLAIKTDQS